MSFQPTIGASGMPLYFWTWFAPVAAGAISVAPMIVRESYLL